MEKIIKDKINFIPPLAEGELVEGKIIGFGRSALYIDLSPRGTAIVYGREFYDVKNALKDLDIGDSISGEITNTENEEGYPEMSIKKAFRQRTWKDLIEKKEQGETIEVRVSGANKGGLIVKIEDIQAFLPASQLSFEHFPRVEDADKNKILNKLGDLVGQTLKVKVLDLDRKEEKLILSEKLEEMDKTRETLKSYQPGDLVQGEITGLADFGAFIRFGESNLEGLIHISELDWGLVRHPSDIVKVGEKVKARIVEIGKDGRVSLSLKTTKTPKKKITPVEPEIKTAPAEPEIKEKQAVKKTTKKTVVKKAETAAKEPTTKTKTVKTKKVKKDEPTS
jgi:small subunit ribosomal protein S1